jgi:hypothetical protein
LSTVDTALDIGNLTTPCLTRLTISNGTIYNPVPALVLTKGLQNLKFGNENGNAVNRLRLVEVTSLLKTLYAGQLAPDELFIEMAAHESIKDFAIPI